MNNPNFRKAQIKKKKSKSENVAMVTVRDSKEHQRTRGPVSLSCDMVARRKVLHA